MTGPTVLTLARIILSILFMILAILPDTWAKIISIAIFIIAAVTDKIDGIWARKSKQVTDMGAFLDPLADKILVNLAFLALVYLHIIPVWVFAIILIRDFAVDGMRMMLARRSITLSASFYGKLKTTTQMIALVILLLNLILNNEIISNIGNILLYLALIMTVFSGIDYLYHGWQKIK